MLSTWNVALTAGPEFRRCWKLRRHGLLLSTLQHLMARFGTSLRMKSPKHGTPNAMLSMQTSKNGFSMSRICLYMESSGNGLLMPMQKKTKIGHFMTMRMAQALLRSLPLGRNSKLCSSLLSATLTQALSEHVRWRAWMRLFSSSHVACCS